MSFIAIATNVGIAAVAIVSILAIAYGVGDWISEKFGN